MPKPTTQTSDSEHPLLGLFFLTYAEGKMQWQGRVQGIIRDELLLVQLFSWMAGEPTNLCLVSIADTVYKTDNKGNHWDFYADPEIWKFYAETKTETLANPAIKTRA